MPRPQKQTNFLNQLQEYMNSNPTLGSEQERGGILSAIESGLFGTKTFSQSAEEIVAEVNKTGYSIEKIGDFIYNYYMSLDPKEMYNEMTSLWPKGVEKPQLPSDEELETRKKMVVETCKVYLNHEIQKCKSDKGLDVGSTVKNYSSNFAARNFSAFMFIPKEEAYESNKQCLEAFISGDKDKIKAEVEKVYDRYLADEYLLDRKYTDKELIENWGKLGPMVTGLGMEYESIQKGLKDMGIVIDPGKQKKLDAAFAKAYAFNNVYKPRMQYYSTSVAMLGDTKQFADIKINAAMKISKDPEDPNNPEFAIGTKAANLEQTVSAIGYGGYVKRTVFQDAKDIEIIYDKEGKTYKPEQTGAYGAALRDGKELYYIKKGEMQKHVLSSKEDGFPFEPKEETKKPATPKERDELFNAKMQALMDSDEPQPMKDIKENVLYNQYKLALICANPKSPTFAADYKNTLANLAAAVTIQQMAETTAPTEEILKGLADPKTLKDCAKSLRTSGFAEKMAEKFKDNPSAITEMTTKEIFGKVAETERQMSKAAAKTNDAPKKESQGPVME